MILNINKESAAPKKENKSEKDNDNNELEVKLVENNNIEKERESINDNSKTNSDIPISPMEKEKESSKLPKNNLQHVGTKANTTSKKNKKIIEPKKNINTINQDIKEEQSPNITNKKEYLKFEEIEKIKINFEMKGNYDASNDNDRIICVYDEKHLTPK